MDQAYSTGRDSYRLIVTRRNASEILLLTGGSAWSLPAVEIGQRQRIAQQLTAELYAHHGCWAYCLLVPTLAAGLPHCAVMEVPDPGDISSAGTCWKPFDAATRWAIDSAEDRTLVEKSIEELDSCRRKPNEAPFARPGWLSELFAWAKQQLDPLGVRLTGSFRQLNASPSFSLMRLETNDSAAWFKAAGEPNRHELPITTCIDRLFPGYVPEVLGVEAAWNGWLTREAPGRTLNRRTELPLWLKAAEDLARLQIRSIGKQAELLEASCRDLRVPRLIEEIDPFVDRMRGLMTAQEKQTPARLTGAELTHLGDSLKQACLRLSDIGLPDTLGHLDFNPANIVVSPERSVFLDWAEGCVANPLITFEYLCEHLRQSCAKDTRAIDNMVAAYTRPWLSLFAPDVLEQAARSSPIVAVFAYAAGLPRWQSPAEALRKPSLAAHLRSLARRMFREAGQMMERSERCLA